MQNLAESTLRWFKMPGLYYSEDEVEFDFCIHKDRYPIKSAKFLDYLTTHCKGFTIAEDRKYSVHYLMVILLTNWGCQQLISKCKIKITKQIRDVFDIHCEYMPIYFFRYHIFLLLKTQLNYSFRRYTAWSLHKRTIACAESGKEAELIGKIQQGHHECNEHSCIDILNCYGYFIFCFDDKVTPGFITPSPRLLLFIGH